MKELILHIGHGKTGSSYLQSIFALNLSLLKAAEITYPYHKSFDIAEKGDISSGNYEHIYAQNLDFEGRSRMLVSGEPLFYSLFKKDLLGILSQNYKLKVILFTRNVVDHAVSRWSQGVKRGGVKADVDAFLATNPVGPHRTVPDWIEASEKLKFELIVRNYSRHKSQLSSVFFADAFNGDCSVSDLKLPKKQLVNRGLTNSEYELQRIFNAIGGPESSTYVSDFVVNNFPDVKPSPIYLSKKTYDVIVEANAPYLEKINPRIGADEHVSFGSEADFVKDKKAGDCFANEVVLALAQNIVSSTPLQFARNKNAYIIRDLALRIEQGEQLDLQDALSLMKMALELNPSGPVIRAKVEEWDKKLNS